MLAVLTGPRRKICRPNCAETRGQGWAAFCAEEKERSMVLNHSQQEKLTLAIQSGILLAALACTARAAAKTPDLKKMKKAAAYAKKIKKLNSDAAKAEKRRENAAVRRAELLRKKMERAGA